MITIIMSTFTLINNILIKKKYLVFSEPNWNANGLLLSHLLLLQTKSECRMSLKIEHAKITSKEKNV